MLVKFKGVLYLKSVLTFEAAKVIEPSLTKAEYNSLMGIEDKKETKEKKVK